MNKKVDDADLQKLALKLKTDLISHFGVMMTGEPLYQNLGFPSGGAFRQAKSLGKIPVPLFELKGKRGCYALAEDVAMWIANERLANVINTGTQDPKIKS